MEVSDAATLCAPARSIALRSVWRSATRRGDAVIVEIVEPRRCGFRRIALADDKFSLSLSLRLPVWLVAAAHRDLRYNSRHAPSFPS
jgi:hypothetical protein